VMFAVLIRSSRGPVFAPPPPFVPPVPVAPPAPVVVVGPVVLPGPLPPAPVEVDEDEVVVPDVAPVVVSPLVPELVAPLVASPVVVPEVAEPVLVPAPDAGCPGALDSLIPHAARSTADHPHATRTNIALMSMMVPSRGSQASEK
jgi:hypothetical protein